MLFENTVFVIGQKYVWNISYNKNEINDPHNYTDDSLSHYNFQNYTEKKEAVKFPYV